MADFLIVSLPSIKLLAIYYKSVIFLTTMNYTPAWLVCEVYMPDCFRLFL